MGESLPMVIIEVSQDAELFALVELYSGDGLDVIGWWVVI